MENLKEKYDLIDKWYKSQDEKKILYLLRDRLYDDGKPQVLLQNTVRWYLEIKELKEENKSFIFGDRLVSLKDISNHMLNKLPDIDDTDDEEESFGAYDEDGYASNDSINELKSFWSDLSDNEILAVAGNATIDEYELDVNGGRCYYMNGEDTICMIFNYLYYTMKLTPEKFDDNICNSGNITEELAFYYSGKSYAKKGLTPYLPTSIVLDDMYQKLLIKNNASDINSFNHQIKYIIENFKDKEMFAEKLEILKDLML